jgi:hypothetical protein
MVTSHFSTMYTQLGHTYSTTQPALVYFQLSRVTAQIG